MDNLIPINIVIADRTYRIKTLAADEEIIRKTIKIINDKLIELKTQFAGKDMQDYIAMVIIWYATQAETTPAGEGINPETLLRLLSLEKQADKLIS
ncbi:MAG: cell division protein ZapA [Ferruginibacter sp.]